MAADAQYTSQRQPTKAALCGKRNRKNENRWEQGDISGDIVFQCVAFADKGYGSELLGSTSNDLSFKLHRRFSAVPPKGG
eukprot:scaffold288657_cov21-Tisochrysis_lutea.AAC.1